MILAELEVYHSRPIAPTRRVAVGDGRLPVDPPPGFGGILLGGVVAQNIGGVDADLVPDLIRLTEQLEHGFRIPQPRLRHRFQADRVGLQRSVHRLRGTGPQGRELAFEFDDEHGNPAQQLLGAVYAAGQLPLRHRSAVMATIRRAIGWSGPVGPDLIATLAGFRRGGPVSALAMENPVEWALDTLGFVNGDRHPDGDGAPSRSDIQRRFRKLLIEAHPDHGGEQRDAASRIADLTEARRILLG